MVLVFTCRIIVLVKVEIYVLVIYKGLIVERLSTLNWFS